MENYEEKILELLKEEGEALKIPETLSPESIKETLRKKKLKRKIYRKWIAGMAAAACVGLGVWSGLGKTTDFVPQVANKTGNEVQKYDSLYTLLTQIPETTARDLESGVEAVKTEVMPAVYSRTNARTSEVEEGDLVKSDGTFLYALMTPEEGEGKELYILLPENGGLKEVSKITDLGWNSEFYVQGDLLLFIESLSLGENGLITVDGEIRPMEQECTRIHVYDIADREKPRLVKILEQSGIYETSRLHDGVLYTLSRFFAQPEKKTKPEEYVPATEGSLLPLECIYLPKEAKSSTYLVMTALSLDTPESFCDRKAVLSVDGNYYVSKEHIYIFRNEFTKEEKSRTEIWRYRCRKGTIYEAGKVCLPGQIDDSFSLDEYEGKLRVLTSDMTEDGGNSLYLLDEELETEGKLTGLAKGERIYSARFLGEMAYFVTFKNTDPLFCVDISNPEKPRLLGELKIEGVSEYLHFYGEDRLLGIGREIDPKTGEEKGLKLAMFDVSDPLKPKEEKKLVLEDCFDSSAFYDYRTILVSPEKNRIGFMAEEDYYLFSYDKENGFEKELVKEEASLTEKGEYQEVRGAYIENSFYLLQDRRGISTYHLTTNKKTGEWKND